MKNVFSKSQWIWVNDKVTADQYVQFADNFVCNGGEQVLLSLSFDSVVNVYVNEQLVFFKQCADYPFFKTYDQVDVTKYCKQSNDLRIEVWYYGADNATYYKANAGLIYQVEQADRVLCCSGSHTQSRLNVRYKNNYCKNITHQLGYSFFFDNTASHLPFGSSVVVNKPKQFTLCASKPLQLLQPTPFNVIQHNQNSILVDLGKEEVGFLSLQINSSVAQDVVVAYGEHIADGKVRQLINGRDFSVQVRLSQGNNNYANYFRRLAGRYLQLYFNQPLQVDYLGLTPVSYPLQAKPFTAKTPLQQRIYDVCARTLSLCMHEHYEDCPWREQALYAMDSRNQMLCGYYAFGEYDFARHNLVLMSKGLTNNGLLELTYPAKDTPAIPFFSLVYPMAVAEYIEHSGDASILDEVAPTIKSITSVFAKHVASNGLVANLPYPFWNFYEWAEGSHNDSEITRTANEPHAEQYDLILNCAYVLALQYCDKLFGTKTDLTTLRDAIKDNFFDQKRGLYRATVGKDLFTELGNSLAILSGVSVGKQASNVAQKLMTEGEMVKVTLSMQCFKYDALLQLNKANANYVIADIERNYGYMLSQGATSVWETIEGQTAFDNAGSLCHGWSAMPVYYLNVLTEQQKRPN